MKAPAQRVCWWHAGLTISTLPSMSCRKRCNWPHLALEHGGARRILGKVIPWRRLLPVIIPIVGHGSIHFGVVVLDGIGISKTFAWLTLQRWWKMMNSPKIHYTCQHSCARVGQNMLAILGPKLLKIAGNILWDHWLWSRWNEWTHLRNLTVEYLHCAWET